MIYSLRTIATACFAALFIASIAAAQSSPWHQFHRADMPPGTVGQGQLLRGGPLPGYFQPVEIRAPEGAQISLAEEGRFGPRRGNVVTAGMMIGQVYRLQISNIPALEGEEVYPTIEVINRLYPPAGLEWRHPIPIELTFEELRYAMQGKLVTRVIYLENPQAALPQREDPARQSYFEVPPTEDPLTVADGLGRPMAILRMGSRTPDADGPDGRFLYGSPAFVLSPLGNRPERREPPPREPLRQPKPLLPLPGDEAEGTHDAAFPPIPAPQLRPPQPRPLIAPERADNILNISDLPTGPSR